MNNEVISQETETQVDADGNNFDVVVSVTSYTPNFEISGTDILAINSELSDISSAPFKTCTDGTKISFALLDSSKNEITGVHDNFVFYNDSTRTLTIITSKY
jgi:hypothetical protein